MLNSVNLIGRLTKDVEIKKTQTGKEVATFSIAVGRQIKREDKDNPNVTKADYPTIVAWNHIANFVDIYCKQGDLIAVKGKLNTRSYEDSMVKGRKIFVTEILAESIDLLKKADTKPVQRQEPQQSYTREDITEFAPEDLPF